MNSAEETRLFCAQVLQASSPPQVVAMLKLQLLALLAGSGSKAKTTWFPALR